MFATGTRRAAVTSAGLATMALLALACRPMVAQEFESDVWGPDEPEMEHVLRGPLHEAVAKPVSHDAQAGIVVPRAPPDPIEEIPPDIKPADDAIWVPGYWAWDDEREDFLWITGAWRVAPPERRWVPGYWLQVDNGYQWISGFWAPLEADQLSYLPEPPETLETGPSSPAPSDDHFWVNGCWEYVDGRYAWRSGYWAPGRDDWVWVPAHYAWTPQGCLYVDGYWDYRLPLRAMCFAPVYWHRPIYARPGYFYRPFRVLDLVRLHLHLFVRPRYGHYYYGDWYGPYDRFGIYPSFYFHGRYGYDPLWTYYRWHFSRRGIDYADRVRGWHHYFERHSDRRPPRTWNEQRQFVERHRGEEQLRHVVLGDDVRRIASRDPRRVERVGDDFRRRMQDDARELRNLADVRRARDTEGRAGPEGRGPQAQRRTLRLPETPDVRRGRERVAEGARWGEDRRAEQRRGPGPDRFPGSRETQRPESRPDVPGFGQPRDQGDRRGPPQRIERPGQPRGEPDVRRPGRPDADRLDRTNPGRDRPSDAPGAIRRPSGSDAARGSGFARPPQGIQRAAPQRVPSGGSRRAPSGASRPRGVSPPAASSRGGSRPPSISSRGGSRPPSVSSRGGSRGGGRPPSAASRGGGRGGGDARAGRGGGRGRGNR